MLNPSKPGVLAVFSWDVEVIKTLGKNPVLDFDLGVLERIGRMGMKHSFFVQADPMMEERLGSAAALFSRNDGMLRRLSEGGHEIGFHFHPIKMTAERGWVQTTDDNETLPRIRSAMRSVRKAGFRPVSSRMGWGYGSAALLNALAKEGITTDGSAMPGIVSRKKNWDNVFDWRGAPEHPYRPSSRDHRKPGRSGRRRTLLEVPLTMLRDAPFMLARYPAETEGHILKAFRSSERSGAPVMLHGYAHNTDMTALGMRKMEYNAKLISKISRRIGIPVAFCTISEAADFWRKHGKPWKAPERADGFRDISPERIALNALFAAKGPSVNEGIYVG